MTRAVHEPAFRGGSGAPLLLLNGGPNTWTSWEPVLPYLTACFDVLAPSHAGNAGGPALPDRPLSLADWVDAAEAAMDRAGWPTAHVAGYSLGGWVAMELGRRGRARSIWAFSPAGGWTTPWRRWRVIAFFHFARFQSWMPAPVRWVLTRSSRMRRLLLHGTATRGDLMPQAHLMRLTTELREQDWRLLQAVRSAEVSSYDDPGVPVTLAWAGVDRLLTVPQYSEAWRAATPHAEWRVVPGVGHMPTYDDPELIAAEIIRTTRRCGPADEVREGQ